MDTPYTKKLEEEKEDFFTGNGEVFFDFFNFETEDLSDTSNYTPTKSISSRRELRTVLLKTLEGQQIQSFNIILSDKQQTKPHKSHMNHQVEQIKLIIY